MRLLPREEDRLLLFLAAELARRRRARGLKLTQAEAAALVADEVCEAARDGCSYAEALARGYAVVGEGDVLDGVADLLPRVEVEAAFADGSRLVVLEDPVRRAAAPAPAQEPPVPWLDHADAVDLAVVNEGAVPVGVTSHFHLFEVNPALRLTARPRGAGAWRSRRASRSSSPPASRGRCGRCPSAARASCVGTPASSDGPLDAPGAREAALERARAQGYRGA